MLPKTQEIFASVFVWRFCCFRDAWAIANPLGFNLPSNIIVFAMPPFLKKHSAFYKTVSKLSPRRPLKQLEISKSCFYYFYILCLCLRPFFHDCVGKWPSFLEVRRVTFEVMLPRFFLLWLPRPHVCRKTHWWKNHPAVSLEVDTKTVKLVSRRLDIRFDLYSYLYRSLRPNTACENSGVRWWTAAGVFNNSEC